MRVLEKVGDEAGKGNIESEAEVEAETYVWVAGGEGLEEGEWDFGEFQREKMGRWVGGTTEEYDGELRPSDFGCVFGFPRARGLSCGLFVMEGKLTQN